MSSGPDTPSRRVSFAIGISVLMHALALWGTDIRLPQAASSLPPLVAKLEALPVAPAKPRPKRRAAPSVAKPAPALPAPADASAQPPQPVALPASTPVETETLAAEEQERVERPPLPRRAQLTFDINKGTSHFRVGEAVHTLEINDGRYVLRAVTKTVGLVSLFKSYELDQYSNGSYSQHGLLPELFVDESKGSSPAQRNAVEFDREARLARFSNGREAALTAETQDILSVMYQFPPLANADVVAVSVSNGKKVEQYQFEITADEEIETALGKLLTVRLHKLHAPNEEGLDIWLAREYRLFPVKIRFIEKNGEVAAEAVVTDIRVSEEQGVRSNAVN